MFIQDMSPIVLGAGETHQVCLTQRCFIHQYQCKIFRCLFARCGVKTWDCNFRKIPSLHYAPFLIIKKGKRNSSLPCSACKHLGAGATSEGFIKLLCKPSQEPSSCFRARICCTSCDGERWSSFSPSQWCGSS